MAPSDTSSPDRSSTLKLLLKIHWISSAVCLLGMLLFSVTGMTLNHAGQIEASPRISRAIQPLPGELQALLQQRAAQQGKAGQLPDEATRWVREALGARIGGVSAEWSADEIYVPLPKPGGDAWLRFDLVEGEAEYELTDRGWISWLNDLHKGRHTGVAWSWFIDVFAFTCLVFSLSGLWVLKIHAVRRHSVWPLVGLGAVLPLLIVLLFVH